MGMPSDIGIIDLMLGIPSADPKSDYDFLRPLLRDRESLESFEMPVEYLFKDLPRSGGRVGDELRGREGPGRAAPQPSPGLRVRLP